MSLLTSIHSKLLSLHTFHSLQVKILYESVSSIKILMLRDLSQWKDKQFSQVADAGRNFYANKIIFLEYQIELHENYSKIFSEKEKILKNYFSLNLNKINEKSLLKDNYLREKLEEDESTGEEEISQLLRDNLTHNLSSIGLDDSPYDNISNVFSSFSLFNNNKNNKNNNLTKEENNILSEVNLVNFGNFEQIEKNIFEFQKIINCLFLTYDKLRNKNKKFSWTERRQLLVEMVEEAGMNLVEEKFFYGEGMEDGEDVEEDGEIGGGFIDEKEVGDEKEYLEIESLKVNFQKNKKFENIKAISKSIILDGSYYFPYCKRLRDMFEEFLSNARFREGIFANRWVNIVKKDILSVKERNKGKGENKENNFSDESITKLSNISKKDFYFYDKLINETLKILVSEYNLPINTDDNLNSFTNKFEEDQEKLSHAVLKIEIERYYFEKLSKDILSTLRTEEIISMDKLFDEKILILRGKFSDKDFAKYLGIEIELDKEIFYFGKAILELEKLNFVSAPIDIIFKLVSFVRSVCSTLEELGVESKALSADFLFPYLVYCVVNSEMKEAHMMFRYLEFVAEKSMSKGEMGLCSSMVNAVVIYIAGFEEA